MEIIQLTCLILHQDSLVVRKKIDLDILNAEILIFRNSENLKLGNLICGSVKKEINQILVN